MRRSIKNISAEDAEIINDLLSLDLDEVKIDDISEEDLFNIGKETLKIKKAIHSYLEEAVNLVLLPRVSEGSRMGTSIHDKEFVYLELGDKLYAVSGNQANFYGSRVNKMYDYLLALNLSGILDIN